MYYLLDLEIHFLLLFNVPNPAVVAHAADVGPHGAGHHVMAVELGLGRFRSSWREGGRSRTVRS